MPFLKKVAFAPLLVLSIMLLLTPSDTQATSPLGSLRLFVQGFYDWYVPIANKHNDVPSSDIALKQKASLFSPQLLTALREDSEAQAKVSGEIVGIDWDPFLNSQDPAKHYQVGLIMKKGATYMVDVHSIQDGKKSPKADVIVEVGQKDGKWFFVNFHMPEGGDLLSSLELLKKERQESH